MGYGTLLLVRLGEIIGENVRIHRDRKGLTQEVLAERAGVSHSTIAHLESTGRIPKQSTVSAVAKVLGVPEWMLGVYRGKRATAQEAAVIHELAKAIAAASEADLELVLKHLKSPKKDA